MAAQQGQRYRVRSFSAAARKRLELDGKDPDSYRPPKRAGQGTEPDRYTGTFTDADGNELVLEDIIGDVILASENVDYPRGPQTQYRHVDWIDEHPQRFELLPET